MSSYLHVGLGKVKPWRLAPVSPAVSRMLLQPVQKPPHVEGAGDAFLQPVVPPRFERLLNVLLLLAALHFLIQTAIYFSCLFLLLPMSFVISNVISGANTIMAAASSENLQMGQHQGQGAAAVKAPQMGFLSNVQGIEELVVSMAAAYFLVRAGLVFCNLIFILPLIFFLNEANSS
ncbi:hypothetical protein JD844_026064 [Phrynosoma platyrhinos]|uniref:Uncharacterized protein n=1 Tax=Phrynosoma platyrhinos TaxID=52577 RepID=A0ABQ7SEF2_PHRPL|nr:hypothetical protein JD844_026064 [Phrynosoma platyrhinos]